MKLTIADIEPEFAKLGCLGFFPSTDEAAGELVRAFRDSCASKSHLRATVEEIIREFEQCPKPKEIRAVAMRLRPATGPSSGCPECSKYGTRGFIWFDAQGNQYSVDGYLNARYENVFGRKCKCAGGTT